ncbi:MAG: site-2 protease family protein [candidate division WOR-3 bacterium]|jgi:Zn-dependent protease|nr:site-2 protease family protein [candidate division WOR-3 bacterium]MCR4423649.1 site-2 protease family protein [candidate division WOR-3 bacterium]MDH7518988.1 site-2 protease family protein [bacterium]
MDWGELIISAPAILFGLTVHEFSHGYAAFILGDPTAKQSGRLTLNPLKHLDPLGTILLFLPWTRFGWAKPVPINPNNFKNPLRDLAISALAGPIANFLVAIFAGIVARILTAVGVNGFAWKLTSYFVIINLILCFFNLIPLPPLDGSRLIYYLLPSGLAARYGRLEQSNFLSLIVILVFGLPLFRMFVFPMVLTTARLLLGTGVWF